MSATLHDVAALEAARQQMIAQQLRTWEVLDNRVLDALHSVRREQFVPKSFQSVAFADAEIPLGHGQVMLPPKLDGKILQALSIASTDHALDVGSGSGFLAALMGKLGEQVRSVEIVPELVALARTNVHAAAANNVSVEQFDATQLAEENHYHAIAVTASIPPHNDDLELRFKRALKVGGRLFMVLGAAPVMQAVRYTRTTLSHWQREELFETLIPAMMHAALPPKFTF